jgi:two-component system nitrogen regulation sensor histidine kinase GlnL
MDVSDATPFSDGRILEHLTVAVLVLDEQLRPEFLNSAAEILLSVSRQRARRQTLRELLPGNDAFVTQIEESIAGGYPFTEREVRLRVNLEHVTTIDCTVTPLTVPPASSRLLLEMVDLDRHVRIAEEEARLNQQRISHALLRGLAHEIKNPLGGLRGAAQLLARELPDPQLSEFTTIIIGEADRLRNLVDSMLGPSHPPQRRSVNIHEVSERVRQLLAAESPAEIRLTSDYDPSIPPLEADSDQLIQAILNVARNAVQALDGRGTIVFRTRTLRQYTLGHRRHKLVLRLDIVDNGPGIPEYLKGQIFYPLISGREQGTGLGLPIAQSLINQHGGLIECASRPGETVFTFLLPLVPDHERATPNLDRG